MSKSHGMAAAATSWILSEGYAGLQAQALGLAEAAGLQPELRVLKPHAPWKWLAASLWPAPLAAVREAVRSPLPGLVIGCGGVAAAVGAALRSANRKVVQVQHPRIDARRFDLVLVTRHDQLTGPNVIVTRTALHRASPARLADAAQRWAAEFAHLKRPLVAVLVGGSNGRFRLDASVARELTGQIATMMKCDSVGAAVTPSRRTDPAVMRVLTEALTPLGAYVWNGKGDNPYFGMLALADAIIVTLDSVSMISEAVATTAPVMLATLPGRSRRINLFTQGLLAEGRVREFAGRFDNWPVAPLDDTAEAAAEMCRRLGIVQHPEIPC
jgi:uncharacterized protein